MKEHIYDRFVENDFVCVSFTKNVFTESAYAKFCKCADSTVDIELPFTFLEGNRPSTLGVFSFSLSKWFEEFEYVDSKEKCLKFLERISVSGNRRGADSYDYYAKSVQNFNKYDWTSNPLIAMISDKLLICDILQIIDKQFCRISHISYDGSIYETRSLWYTMQQCVIYNERPHAKIVKRKGYRSTQVSPIHDMFYHYGWDKCVDGRHLGLIGYSPRNSVRMMILHELSAYNGRIRDAKAAISDAETNLAELRGNLAELEIRLSSAGL